MAWDKKGENQARAGKVVRGGKGGRPQLQDSDGWHWTEEAESLFFDELATSANVTRAANAAGFCTPTVYRLRQRRADFALKWQTALEQGYARLEAALLRAAADTMEGWAPDPERPFPDMSVEEAMNVLRAHRNELRHSSATGRGPGRGPSIKSIDEVKASILKRIEAIERASEDEVPEVYREEPSAIDGSVQG